MEQYYDLRSTVTGRAARDHQEVMDNLLTRYITTMVGAYKSGPARDMSVLDGVFRSIAEGLKELSNGLTDLRQEEHPGESRELSEQYTNMLYDAAVKSQ